MSKNSKGKNEGGGEVIPLRSRQQPRQGHVGARPLRDVIADNASQGKRGNGEGVGTFKNESEAHWATIGLFSNSQKKAKIIDQITKLQGASVSRICLSTPNPSAEYAQDSGDVLSFFGNAGAPHPVGKEKQKLLEEFLTRNFQYDPVRGHPKFFFDPMTGTAYIEWRYEP